MNRIYRKLYSERIRIRRKLFSHTTNDPYLSGDSLSAICDAAFGENIQVIGPARMKLTDAKSIFCESKNLEELLVEFGSKLNAKVIFVGNGDEEFHDLPYTWPRNLKKIYLQNSFISDSKRIFTLPIGIENKRLGNSKLQLLKSVSHNYANKKILFGPFGQTHNSRENLYNIFTADGYQEHWHYEINRLPKHKYRKLLKNFACVACPRGNGVDTHRLWETIYLGRYPIIENNPWADSLSYLKTPLIQINEWSKEEVLSLNLSSVQKFSPQKIESIWIPYWIKLLKSV